MTECVTCAPRVFSQLNVPMEERVSEERMNEIAVALRAELVR